MTRNGHLKTKEKEKKKIEIAKNMLKYNADINFIKNIQI